MFLPVSILNTCQRAGSISWLPRCVAGDPKFDLNYHGDNADYMLHPNQSQPAVSYRRMEVPETDRRSLHFPLETGPKTAKVTFILKAISHLNVNDVTSPATYNGGYQGILINWKNI